MSSKESHAIILGAGFSGLLAANAIAKYFQKVTLVEPDEGTDSRLPRRMVPQANHIHVLVHPGIQLIRNWFPSLDLKNWSSGGKSACYSEVISGVFLGLRHKPFKSFLEAMPCDRAEFEYAIRKEVEKVPNINVIKGYAFENYIYDSEKKRILGAEIVSHDKNHEKKSLMGDLIIDCCGRASKTPMLFKKMGFPEISELKIGINMQYASQIFEIDPEQQLPWQVYFSMEGPPQTHDLISSVIGKNRVILTAHEMAGDFHVKDEKSLMEYFHKVADKSVYDFITEHTKPISEFKTYLIPKSFFRRYDLLPDWPNGLIVIGDAVSVFNPKYGQGMAKVALEVDMLEKALKDIKFEESGTNQPGFEKRFQKAIASKIIMPYWEFLAGSDLMLPGVEGDRPKGVKFFQWYATNLLEVGASDQKVLEQFFRVAALESKPPSLLKPSILFKVLKHAFWPRSKIRE